MTEPGWYKDSADDSLARWFDGSTWTEHTVKMSDWAGGGTPPPPVERQPAFSAAPPSATSPPTRQEAKADAAAAQARAKAMRPWFKKKRFVLPLGLVVLIVVIAAASGGGDKKDSVTAASDTTVAGETTTTGARSVNASTSHPAADDAAVTSCENEGYGTVKVVVQFTNHTTKTSNYLADIEIKDSSGTKVGDGGASTNNLTPGQAANIDGYGLAGSSTHGAVSCVITSVTRYASP